MTSKAISATSVVSTAIILSVIILSTAGIIISVVIASTSSQDSIGVILGHHKFLEWIKSGVTPQDFVGLGI